MLEVGKARVSHDVPQKRNACRIDVVELIFNTHEDRSLHAADLKPPRRRLAAKLAAIRHSTKTDAVLSALENELARIEGEKSLAERLKPLQERIAAVPRTGLEADKDFYDDLSGD